jgi:hypothetical protein
MLNKSQQMIVTVLNHICCQRAPHFPFAILLILTSGCHDSPQMLAAKEKMAGYMAARFRQCGENLAFQYPGSPNAFGEVRSATWKMEEQSLSEANRLNGVEFIGVVSINLSTSRKANPVTRYDNILDSRRPYHYEWCWSKWRDGFNLETFEIAKVNGRWQFATLDNTSEVIFKEQAAQCKAVDSIKDCP